MKIGPTIVMVIVAIGGVVAAAAVEHFDAAGAASGTGGRRPLFGAGVLPVEQIHRIALARADGTGVAFERDEKGWRQTEPFDYPLNATDVETLIRQATELEVIDVIEGGGAGSADGAPIDAAVDTSVLGLDPPHARVVMQWPGGSTDLRLGRRGIAGRAYLALGGGTETYVVNQDLHQTVIDTDVKEWRDRRIFRDVGIESNAIEIRSGESVIRLERDRRQWKMTAPVATRVDGPALDVLFQTLGRAQSSGFILDEPVDLARFGLREPAGVVAVTTNRVVPTEERVARETDVQRLFVGARIGVGSQDRFGLVEGRDVVVRVSEPVLQALFRQARSLVAATPSGVEPADVKSIRIKTAEHDFRLERDLDRWTAPDHGDAAVVREKVDGLLKTLTGVRASEVAIQPYPRELEVATITLFGVGGAPIDTVRVAREPATDDAGGRWALENGDHVMRIYPAGLILPLRPREFNGDMPHFSGGPPPEK